jgi:hypothetical protein
MMSAVALLTSGTLIAIAAIHAYWGIGGRWPAATEKDLARTVVGRPGIMRMPSPTACFMVAALLGLVALWPLTAIGLVALPVPTRLVLAAGVGIAIAFILRGIAPYISAWRRIWPEQPFARLDQQIYGPLCLALGAACLILLFAGSRP